MKFLCFCFERYESGWGMILYFWFKNFRSWIIVFLVFLVFFVWSCFMNLFVSLIYLIIFFLVLVLMSVLKLDFVLDFLFILVYLLKFLIVWMWFSMIVVFLNLVWSFLFMFGLYWKYGFLIKLSVFLNLVIVIFFSEEVNVYFFKELSVVISLDFIDFIEFLCLVLL